MNIQIIILSFLCILETLIIYFLLRKTKKVKVLQTQTMIPEYVVTALKKNGYTIKDLSIENLEDNLRMFKLQIQNQEYEKAEYRVFEKFKTFLNELWRLKKEENNELASNLLILLQNTLSIEYEDKNIIKYHPHIKQKYNLISKVNENDKLLITKPVWLINGKVIIKGKAKRAK